MHVLGGENAALGHDHGALRNPGRQPLGHGEVGIEALEITVVDPDQVRAYVDRRVRSWLVRRSGARGRGFKHISQDYLHEKLGLYRIPHRRADLPRAKV